MNAAQTARIKKITAHFVSTYARSSEAQYDLEGGAMKFLCKMAKSNLSLEIIFNEITNHNHEGYAVPCIRLGLEKAPRAKSEFMANIRVARSPLSRNDVVEMYGEKAHW